MLPTLAPADASDVMRKNTIKSCQVIGRCVTCSDKSYCLSCKNGRNVAITPHDQVRHATRPVLVTTRSTSFCREIMHVVALCAKKQVSGIAAWWVVAAMKHIQTVCYRSEGKEPSHSMGSYGSVADQGELTVSTWYATTSPFPALVRGANSDVRPETRDALFPGHGFRSPTSGRILYSHVTSSGSVVRSRMGLDSHSAPTILAPVA